jgi:hypothetical protein
MVVCVNLRLKYLGSVMKPQLVVLLDSETQQANVGVYNWPEKVLEMESLYGPGREDEPTDIFGSSRYLLSVSITQLIRSIMGMERRYARQS